MSHTDTIIRAYRPETDMKILSDIWLQASLRAHAFIGEQRLREQQILIETRYLPDAETWVACRDGRAVGFISLIDSFIGALFIAADQQGHGIGRALTAHALALKGQLTLEVYTANTQAMHFYEALGFREQSRRPTDDEGLPFENAEMMLTA